MDCLLRITNRREREREKRAQTEKEGKYECVEGIYLGKNPSLTHTDVMLFTCQRNKEEMKRERNKEENSESNRRRK